MCQGSTGNGKSINQRERDRGESGPILRGNKLFSSAPSFVFFSPVGSSSCKVFITELFMTTRRGHSVSKPAALALTPPASRFYAAPGVMFVFCCIILPLTSKKSLSREGQESVLAGFDKNTRPFVVEGKTSLSNLSPTQKHVWPWRT